ncbi:MAG: cysteine--tRNA ligase [Bacteroidota bacterium]
MLKNLRVYNSLTRQKEEFKPLNPPHVGMYVCGPTVYSNVHLGNVRTFMSFDVIYRYLMHLGYKVRYVRNITDVGHLLDDGTDRISKKAKLDNLEPMEVVQTYTNDFHDVMLMFNSIPPSIEPSAIGHLMEQIEVVKDLLEKGMAYESEGSVYFDVEAYNKAGNNYGELSGRVLDELMTGSRDLDGQEEKRHPADFALWKKAAPEHIMRWDSPWGEGFPGWHLECSVMSTKYLGANFDIHGGGLDLKFPHHECEIAQNCCSTGQKGANYWLHTNMLTVNGTKMSKSLGNSFLPSELVSGDHAVLDEGYSPMTVRFFMLQTHYSSTLDFSNQALKASKKGYRKLMNGLRNLKQMEYVSDDSVEINEKQADQVNKLCDNCYSAMNDDFNTALTIAHLFNLTKKVNNIHMGNLHTAELGEETFHRMKKTFLDFTEEVLGLKDEPSASTTGLIEGIIEMYRKAKAEKDYPQVDKIRAMLKAEGVVVKDMKSGTDWAYEE